MPWCESRREFEQRYLIQILSKTDECWEMNDLRQIDQNYMVRPAFKLAQIDSNFLLFVQAKPMIPVKKWKNNLNNVIFTGKMTVPVRISVHIHVIHGRLCPCKALMSKEISCLLLPPIDCPRLSDSKDFQQNLRVCAANDAKLHQFIKIKSIN